MGFFDFLGKKGGEGVSAVEKAKNPISIATKFTPLRMKAHRDDAVTLTVTVKNNLAQKQLISVDVLLPKDAKLGFDRMGIHKFHEGRLGEIAPGATVSFDVQVFGSTQTGAGGYEIELLAYSHYLNYSKVLNHVKKVANLRIV
jgi:hypothetical protein